MSNTVNTVTNNELSDPAHEQPNANTNSYKYTILIYI